MCSAQCQRNIASVCWIAQRELLKIIAYYCKLLQDGKTRKWNNFKSNVTEMCRECKIGLSWWTDPLRLWILSVLYLRGVSSARRTCRASNTFPSSRYSRYFCCSSRNFILCIGKITKKNTHPSETQEFYIISTILWTWLSMSFVYLLYICWVLLNQVSFCMAAEVNDKSHNWLHTLS